MNFIIHVSRHKDTIWLGKDNYEIHSDKYF